MAKRKTKSSALGDDPLAWIAGADEAKENAVKKTKSKKAKSKKAKSKKAKSKKTKVKTNRKSKVREEKIKTDETRLVLDSIITVNDAQTMYTQLNSLLELKQDITIDASAVEMLDTAILQLLLAFVNKIKAQNRVVVWSKPSEEMINRATTLNLQAGLGLDGAT